MVVDSDGLCWRQSTWVVGVTFPSIKRLVRCAWCVHCGVASRVATAE